MRIAKVSPEEARERFLTHVNVEPGGCWTWTGYVIPWDDSTRRGGYGQASYPRSWGISPARTTAHRVAYGIFREPPGRDQDVCHTCDNRLCVNPDHLFVGTPQENTLDMIAKRRDKWQRYPTGTYDGRPHRARDSWSLPAAERQQVRELYAAGRLTQDQVAARFGVSQAAVSRMLREIA